MAAQEKLAQNADLPALAIDARGLRKVYAGGGDGVPVCALNDIDLAIPRGSFFGLLGPNGAGKSTFINLLAGLVNKTAGEVSIWNYDLDRQPRQSRAAIGVVPQELFIDAFFTARESLELQAGMYGVPRAERRTDEILAAMGLSDKADVYPRSLSGGMRRRLLVAKALVHSPPVLILDEPTAGVDIELRQKLWDYVRDLNRAGVTVVLTTHYLEEAEALCDTVAIINKGEVVACDSTKSLLARIDAKDMEITLESDLDELPEPLAAFHAELRGPRLLVVHYQPGRTPAREILAAVAEAGLTVADLRTEQSDLEDIFLQLTRTLPSGG